MDFQGVSQDDSTMHTAGIPPSQGSHVYVVGEGACILFPEPVLSHFNPPHHHLASIAMGRRERKAPQRAHLSVGSSVTEIELQLY